MPRFFEGVMQGIRTKRNVRILNDTHLSSSLLFLCIYLFLISLLSFFGIGFHVSIAVSFSYGSI